MSAFVFLRMQVANVSTDEQRYRYHYVFVDDTGDSSYIGGVAVSGGVGRVTNTIIGTLVIMSLTNGMNLMNIDISYQYIVKGLIFIIAVAFDVRSRNK